MTCTMTYIETCIKTFTHTCVHPYIHTYIIHTYIHACIHTYIGTFLHKYRVANVCVCVCMCVYVCGACECMCVYVCSCECVCSSKHFRQLSNFYTKAAITFVRLTIHLMNLFINSLEPRFGSSLKLSYQLEPLECTSQYL
jgi:hypothetical protein